jgi:ABC-type multidrug transport system fused ATPase/permease subunit
MAVDGFLLEQVSVVCGEAIVLRQVSAHFPGGRCSAVRGASGSGKTTLLRLLNRLIDPAAGRVLLDGVPLTEMDVLVLRRRVGLVAQAPVKVGEAATISNRDPEVSRCPGLQCLGSGSPGPGVLQPECRRVW